MVEKSQKGQGLVEFALVITLLILAALGGLDFAIRFANQELAQHYAFQAARQASIYLNDGTHSCDTFVRNHMSDPILFLVDTGDWQLTLTNCPTDPSWSQISGSPVSATITWQQKTVWWPQDSGIGQAVANGTVVMHDIYQ
jgi:hypothetical protein